MWCSAPFLVPVANAQTNASDLGLRGVTRDRVVIDFGGPNTAKPLHVGHLRCLNSGECLRRFLAACGHDIIRVSIWAIGPTDAAAHFGI
jgi:arginyl-tRNA synthetase